MFRTLPLQRLDKALGEWRALPYMRPADGWLRAIRQALGITTRQLAATVGVSQAAVVDAERNEASSDITLTTLRRYAEALDCELFYALIPRRPLQTTIEERADRVARDEVARLRRAMTPEEQSASHDRVEHEVAALRKKLLEGRRSRLWKREAHAEVTPG